MGVEDTQAPPSFPDIWGKLTPHRSSKNTSIYHSLLPSRIGCFPGADKCLSLTVLYGKGRKGAAIYEPGITQ